MKLITLVAIMAVIAGICLVQESDAFIGGGGARRFGGIGFGGRFGAWGRWGFGWGGFGLPWWAWGGYPGGLWGGRFWGKRSVADLPSTVCVLTSTQKMEQNVTMHCKSPAKEFTCDGLSNLNPTWNIKLNKLALIPVDHSVPISEWDVKVLAMDENTHQLKNFTTIIEDHELTISLVANETIMVPGYLFQEPCWTDFITLVKDTKFDQFEFNINDE